MTTLTLICLTIALLFASSMVMRMGGVAVTLLMALTMGISGCYAPQGMINFPEHIKQKIFMDSTSELHHWLSDDLDKEVIVSVIANTPMVIIVNLATNRSTIIKDRKVVDAWNSATSDVTGEWHIRNGLPVSQETPPGIYSLHDIEHCPTWIPSHPDGFVPTGNEKQDSHIKRSIFKASPELYGACGYHNPLGEFALWFFDAYGYHGTTVDLEYILNLPTEQRRVSGGCVRNPISKIEKLYSTILNELPDGQEYRQKVIQNRNAQTPQTLVRNVSDDFRVVFVIGHFKGDLPFTAYANQIRTVKLAGLTQCTIAHNDAPIYSSTPFREENIVGYYQKGDVIKPLNEIRLSERNPILTDKGWLSQYYIIDSCDVRQNYWTPLVQASAVKTCDIFGNDC